GDRYQTARPRAVPQLARAVRPPAIRGAARRDPASVKTASTDRREREPAGDGDRGQAIGTGRPVAQLAAKPPAIRGAARRDPAGIIIARTDHRVGEPAEQG